MVELNLVEYTYVAVREYWRTSTIRDISSRCVEFFRYATSSCTASFSRGAPNPAAHEIEPNAKLVRSTVGLSYDGVAL